MSKVQENKQKKLVLTSAHLLLLVLFTILLTSIVSADLTSLTVQGKLTNATTGDVLTGSYSINFSIYTTTSGGTALWSQVSTVSTDARGVYSVELKDITLDFDVPYYLGVNVAGDGEMTPRYNLTASPYSFSATGLNETIELNNNVSFDSGTLFIDTTNNRVGIGSVAPTTKLYVGGSINVSSGNDICIDSGNCLSTAGAGSMSNFIIAANNGTDTISDGETINISGTSPINTTITPGLITVSIITDSIGDSQLAFNTGQHLTTTSNPTFAALTVSNIDTGNGSVEIGDAAISDGDTNSVPTADQVYDFVMGQGFGTGSGDVSDVLAGTGITVANSGGPQPNVSITDDAIDGDQLADSITLDANLAVTGYNVSFDSGTLFIDSTANEVGIGTTNPGSTLDVNGQFTATSASFPVGKFERTTTTTGGALTGATGIASGYLLKTTTSGDMTDGFGGGIIFTLNDATETADGNYVARIYARRDGADNEGALQFWAGTGGAEIPMTIRASGNVGIGTTAPSETLEISDGSKSITIDPTATAPTINTTGTSNVTITSSGGSVIIQLG